MPPMAKDGGFLWLVGHILQAVDSDFSYEETVMGVGTRDETETRYIETRYNQKGESNSIGIVETRYNDWHADRGVRNTREIQELNDPDQSRGGWFW
jgi:hypothetical protein